LNQKDLAFGLLNLHHVLTLKRKSLLTVEGEGHLLLF
jgi:hypothetical protein